MAVEVFRPKWAPHVSGTFERVLEDDGTPARIVVELLCDRCKQTHQARCDSGAPTSWVLRFAVNHVHRDALIDEFPGQEKKR
jgi:hypothetical protein